MGTLKQTIRHTIVFAPFFELPLPKSLCFWSTILFPGFLLWRILLRLARPPLSNCDKRALFGFVTQHSRVQALVQCLEQMTGHGEEEADGVDISGDREIGGGWTALDDSFWSCWWRRVSGVTGVSDFAIFWWWSRALARRLRLSNTDLLQQWIGHVLVHVDLHTAGHVVGQSCCCGWKYGGTGCM